jgi:hypothetical protein
MLYILLMLPFQTVVVMAVMVVQWLQTTLRMSDHVHRYQYQVHHEFEADCVGNPEVLLVH